MDGDVEMAVTVENEGITATAKRDRGPGAGCEESNMFRDDGGTHKKIGAVVNTTTSKTTTATSTVECESWLQTKLQDNGEIKNKALSHKSGTENVEMKEVQEDDEDEDDNEYGDSEDEESNYDSDDYNEDDEFSQGEAMTVTTEDGRVFEMDYSNQPVRKLVDIGSKDRVSFGGTRKKAIFRVQLRHYNEEQEKATEKNMTAAFKDLFNCPDVDLGRKT